MAKTYGVGIMGTGTISPSYLSHLPLFAGLEVRGIADILPDVSKAKGEKFGVRVQTPDELLKNSEIDIIVNLTPPTEHFKVSSAIISAGKHAFSEKPFALSLEDGRALKKAAEERNVRVGGAPDTFLGGAHQQVRNLIDAGKIGRVASGTCHVMSRGMEHWHPNPDFFFQFGAGPVLDVGVYYITDLINLIGPVKRVTAFAGSANAERTITSEPMKGQKIKVGTPTTVHGVLEFHNGAIITLGASWDVSSHGHVPIELYGTEGTLYAPDPNFFGGDIITTDRDGTKTPVTPWDHPLSVPNREDLRGLKRADYRAAGLADTIRSIDEGRPARCSYDLVLHVVDVMTSLLRAGETGQVQVLTTTCERPAPFTPDDARALLK
ncbi:MAG TPA: Gfo/Idh/MocA family oxidoreductase [Arsenicitalea sp.]|jgi:predicted dehydrogenase|nr:Gfo/Idh/MocA family oxidoreductase [Arsenicitalea sp.]